MLVTLHRPLHKDLGGGGFLKGCSPPFPTHQQKTIAMLRMDLAGPPGEEPRNFQSATLRPMFTCLFIT